MLNLAATWKLCEGCGRVSEETNEKRNDDRRFVCVDTHLRFISSKRICYILFIEYINSPSNCSPCPQMRRGVSIAVRSYSIPLPGVLYFSKWDEVEIDRVARVSFLSYIKLTLYDMSCHTIQELSTRAERSVIDCWSCEVKNLDFQCSRCVWCVISGLTEQISGYNVIILPCVIK